MALICLLAMVGCSSVATQKGFYSPITAELQAGNFDAAVNGLEAARAAKKFKDKDRFLYFLDAGLANHYARRFDSSIARLSLAESAADELFTRSISRAALSLLLNDNALEYAGEDYEVLYTNLFKALGFIVADSLEPALVELRRADDKLKLLEQKYADAAATLNSKAQADSSAPKINYEAKKVRFHNDAFARYLSMHLYAAAGKMDDARIDHDLLQRAFADQPHIYPFAPPPVRYLSDGKPIVSIVAMAGLSPVKEALELRIRTDKRLNLVQILYTDPQRQGTEFANLPLPISEDYYFDLSLPQIVSRPSLIRNIRVVIDSVPRGELGLIEDVCAIAQESFEAKRSLILLRSVARSLAKGLTTHKLKEKADKGGAGGWLKSLAIDVASDISEGADLRCSRLLPGRIYVGDFDIEPGRHNITVEFLDSAGQVIRTQNISDYQVVPNGLNLVEAVSLN